METFKYFHPQSKSVPTSASGVTIVHHSVYYSLIAQSWAHDLARPKKRIFAGTKHRAFSFQIILNLTGTIFTNAWREPISKGNDLEKSKARQGKSSAPKISFYHLDPAVLELDVDFEFQFYILWVSVTCGSCYRWQRRLNVPFHSTPYSQKAT